jgi:hypothetical protein
MPGLVPGIHVFLSCGDVSEKDVDGRVKPGHDERKNLLVHHRYTRPCAKRLRTLQWRKGAFMMTLKLQFSRSALLAAAPALLAALALAFASPARADRCDDMAGQLKSQIDGLAVGRTVANLIYLSHPQARQITLGCSGRNYSNQLYAKSDSRKPKPAFINLVASAAAIIFTLPKDDMLRGTTRCIKRMGLLRGDKIKMRYRRLDLQCTRTKSEAAIAISRSRDE